MSVRLAMKPQEGFEMKGSYSEFWTTIGDFQTLIAALIGLVAVVGAIYAVWLQARLTDSAATRAARDARIRTAATIRSLIGIERLFPVTSYLRNPTKDEVLGMLTKGTGVGLGPADYLSYLQSFVASLSEYPAPISERASFLSWVSGRTALAIKRVAGAGPVGAVPAATAAVDEVRFLLLSAILVTDKLAAELGTYMSAPQLYEENWRERPKSEGWSHSGHWGTITSDAFSLMKLKMDVLLATRADEQHGTNAPLGEVEV